MTPNEFKAWFDGFTEAFTGCPNKAQWTRIKARVAEIDGKPVTERHYVDRYWPTYVRTYPQIVPQWTTYCGVASGAGVTTNTTTVGLAASNIPNNALSFNSSQAMADLGRAEAKEVA
jgi:hypothetical protein